MHPDNTITLHGIYGDVYVDDPLLCDLIQSPEFTRLQGVHQYGPWDYVVGPGQYTRWEHSLGVFALTKLYGGSYYEQIAALLHDVSHTVFSHAGGWIYNSDYRNADKHQDDIHEWFLERSTIPGILADYGITIKDIHHKRGAFPVLEQELPDICTDRLDYNLQGAYYEGMLTQEDIDTILASLHCENGKWFFDDAHTARLFAQNSIFMCRNIWGSPANGITYYMLGKAMRHALDAGILTTEDIHFSDDDTVLQILKNADNQMIQECLFMIYRYQSLFFVDHAVHDFWVQAKFRGIDPLVKVDGALLRLSACDSEFARLYDSAYSDVTRGWPIRCIKR